MCVCGGGGGGFKEDAILVRFYYQNNAKYDLRGLNYFQGGNYVKISFAFLKKGSTRKHRPFIRKGHEVQNKEQELI